MDLEKMTLHQHLHGFPLKSVEFNILYVYMNTRIIWCNSNHKIVISRVLFFIHLQLWILKIPTEYTADFRRNPEISLHEVNVGNA